MRNLKPEIRPTGLLYAVRKSVSEILDKPFTERIDHQIFKPDQKLLAIWGAECAEHVLPFFEEKYPKDGRPRKAVEVLRDWIATGVFSMAVVRGASLGAHAAAKGKAEADVVFAAHAAGQAAGTAHVATHALAASLYGIRAAAARTGSINDGLKERDWQLERLREHVGRRRPIYRILGYPVTPRGEMVQFCCYSDLARSGCRNGAMKS
jgi:hypothetical protein